MTNQQKPIDERGLSQEVNEKRNMSTNCRSRYTEAELEAMPWPELHALAGPLTPGSFYGHPKTREAAIRAILSHQAEAEGVARLFGDPPPGVAGTTEDRQRTGKESRMTTNRITTEVDVDQVKWRIARLLHAAHTILDDEDFYQSHPMAVPAEIAISNALYLLNLLPSNYVMTNGDRQRAAAEARSAKEQTR